MAVYDRAIWLGIFFDR